MGNNNNYVQYVIASSKNNNKLKYYIVSIYSIQSVLINGWELIVNAHCVKTINLELDEEPQRDNIGQYVRWWEHGYEDNWYLYALFLLFVWFLLMGMI